MNKQHQSLIFDDDIIDQTELCMQALVRSFLSAQTSVRVLDQETNITAKDILCRYREDLERIKFWAEYLLEKNSCSSYTEEP